MIRRELTSIEQGMEILNKYAGSSNVVTVSCVKGALSDKILQPVLNLITNRHPSLNLRIVEKSGKLYFEQAEDTPNIPLRLAKILHREESQDVVREELNQKIDSSNVLWRVVLVHVESEYDISYLVTTFHHAIADGFSCIRLHSDILRYCQGLISDDQAIDVFSLPLLPPLPKLLPKSMQGFRGVINVISYALRLKFLQNWRRSQTLGFEQCVSIKSRRCGLVHKKIDEHLIQLLINLCHQQKTTIQGALGAAMLFVAGSRITAGKLKNVPVNCRSAIDLRTRLKPPVSDENMAPLVSFLMSFHTLQPQTSFWDLAREIKKQLEVGLKGNDIFCPVLIFKKIVDSLFARPNQVPLTVSITNIGRVNIPKFYGSFELEEISFVPSQSAFGGVFAVAVSTFAEQMVLNFMFSKPSISQETMEILANDVLTCIVDACHNESLTFSYFAQRNYLERVKEYV
jgi:NRPS condensation-like uncharacterized protein